MLGHKPIPIREFNGLFDRGLDDTAPPDHALQAKDVIYKHLGVKTRPGSTLNHTLVNATFARQWKRIGEADRLLILNNSGNLYDSTNLTTPILTIAAMTGFGLESKFNRAYITPHNNSKGLPGEKVYVYNGSGAARPAAGAPPSSFSLTVADSAVSGDVEAGRRVYAVAYETESGHITKPGPDENLAVFVSAGAKKVTVSGIQNGPSYVVAKHLLVSKRIADVDWDSNPDNWILYFAPDGKINDNVTTTIDLNFFDADLVDSADYLRNQLAEIPAGVNLSSYQARLIVVGADVDPDVARVSKAGAPESFSNLDGFVIVDPGDAGGGLTNAFEFRALLYTVKNQRLYVSQDNGRAPSSWPVTQVDAAKGTGINGVGVILDSQGQSTDRVIVADQSGLLLFNGIFDETELSWKIDDVWGRINTAVFDQVQVHQDPVLERIYVALPVDGSTTPNLILVGDYQNGLNAERLRWATWEFPTAALSILVDVDFTLKKTIFKYVASGGNVYKLDTAVTNDFTNVINSIYQTALISPVNDGSLIHFGGIRIRCVGSGSLDITLNDLDAGQTELIASITLSASPTIYLDRPISFTAEKMSVIFQCNAIDEFFDIHRIILFTRRLWESRPVD